MKQGLFFDLNAFDSNSKKNLDATYFRVTDLGSYMVEKEVEATECWVGLRVANESTQAMYGPVRLLDCLD